MLTSILAELERHPRGLCAEDLAARLGLEVPTVEGMLQTLLDRGRVALSQRTSGCAACWLSATCTAKASRQRVYRLPISSTQTKLA